MTTNITGLVQAATTTVASIPINWTAVLSTATVSVAAMGTLIKIFGTNKAVKDEDLRDLSIIKEIKESAKADEKKQEELKEMVNILKLEIERLKTETANNSKTIEEIKKDYRELATRLDELLKQILEWAS